MAIILGSASPRRQQLLAQMGLRFTVQSPDIDEDAFSGLSPAELVETLSREKAACIAAQNAADDLIIAADTVVVLDGEILGKPQDAADAAKMLSALSGRQHTVYTGFTVQQGDKVITRHEATKVSFRPLSAAEISHYIATGEPMDKAGAYGIQGFGALLVQGILGDYFTVMGLPVCALGQVLGEFGINLLTTSSARQR